MEPTVTLDIDNQLQPDAVLFIDEAAGGQSRLTEDDYLEGAPELVVEIAVSSAAIDLHTKKTVYRRNGVREYIVWQVLDQKLDWFRLEEGVYVNIAPDEDGILSILRSQISPGLWLDVQSLFAGDMQQVLSVLQEGVRWLVWA